MKISSKNKGKDPVGWTQFEGENLNEAFSRGLIITLPVILYLSTHCAYRYKK